MCHGIEGDGFVREDIRGKGASSIREAIHEVSDMRFLSTRKVPLSDYQIIEIAAYLKNQSGRNYDSFSTDLRVGQDQYRKSCTYCHSFGNNKGGKGGPDLLGARNNYSKVFLAAWTAYTTDMINAGANHSPLKPYWMPDLGHTDNNAWNIAAFMQEQDSPLPDTPAIVMTPGSPAFNSSRDVYFNRCAGCHGLYRNGATGPNINMTRSQMLGTDALTAIMLYGTPRGMGNFGQSGVLTEEEITNLAAYLQLPPPVAPPLEFSEILASWNLIVPMYDRPTVPQYGNWENYFGVILRDAGEVAIFDGDTRREVVRLNTGFAVHILRSSADGRYFYAISRNGLVSLIDLYPAVPQIVATVKGCFDARSVDSSKYDGFEDAYAIEGCYWPPQYVVFNGTTLEPLAKVNIPMTRIDGVNLSEVRVAAIVASQYAPVWIISLKETGYVGIVNYSLPGFPLASTIATVPSLHDGGFDYTGRYFMVAANNASKMVIVDLKNQTFVTSIVTGLRPHPGRGANWLDPDFGWVGSTVHLGEGKVAVYGTDPVNRSNINWTVVRNIPLPSAGSLFIKTHPNSPWVLMDMTMSSDPTLQKQICAINKTNPGAGARCFPVAINGKAVHFEFNNAGTEVWVSDWATNGSLIVLDAQTLDVITRITNIPTPTGKFNVYNTAHDIY